jgi:lipoprotein-anchoring transpeptidase ErfK/SrfK
MGSPSGRGTASDRNHRWHRTDILQGGATPRTGAPRDARELPRRAARTPGGFPADRLRPPSPRRPAPSMLAPARMAAESLEAGSLSRTPGWHLRRGWIAAAIVSLGVGLMLIVILGTTAQHALETRRPTRLDTRRSGTEAVSTPLPMRPATHSALSRGHWITVFGSPTLNEPWIRLETVNPFGQKTPLLALRAVTDGLGRRWIRVLLPIRPNGSSGWVLADDVEIRRERQRIEVDLSRRALVLHDRGRVLLHTRVGVGESQTPTPTGMYFAWARVPQAGWDGPFGRYALGLSGWSRASTGGAGGRLAIHGTSNTGDLGSAVSAGCLRLPNEDTRILQEVPLGTPVFIHR